MTSFLVMTFDNCMAYCPPRPFCDYRFRCVHDWMVKIGRGGRGFKHAKNVPCGNPEEHLRHSMGVNTSDWLIHPTMFPPVPEVVDPRNAPRSDAIATSGPPYVDITPPTSSELQLMVREELSRTKDDGTLMYPHLQKFKPPVPSRFVQTHVYIWLLMSSQCFRVTSFIHSMRVETSITGWVRAQSTSGARTSVICETNLCLGAARGVCCIYQ
eukprot:COSAG02_NODE_532_length_20668_cov_28.281832_15_plen_212_part_00